MMKMSLAIIPSTMRASFNRSSSDLIQERLDDTRMYWNRSVTLLAVRLCLKFTDGSLAGTASILVLTQCSTGHWQWISNSDETVHFLYAFFLAGSAIFVVARIVITVQGLHTRAHLSHSGSGGIGTEAGDSVRTE